jgi:phage tail-like protein
MAEQTTSCLLQYLPAIYQDDPYLGQFLVPFEEALDGFDDLLSSVDRYFAPALTDPDFLPWLANWVALVLDENWPESKRRRLIGEAVELYRWRGTLKGLKRYLEIYTALEPEIRECRWPGGMQIGVASQIGHFSVDPPPSGPFEIVSSESSAVDYYVVDTEGTADGQQPSDPMKFYYRADKVDRVDFDLDERYVEIHRSDGTVDDHQPATINRRDGLFHTVYELETSDDPSKKVTYHGDAALTGERELPYRFIVDVRLPEEQMKTADLDEVMAKVRAIVDREKPAHTAYYLKLTPVAGRAN